MRHDSSTHRRSLLKGLSWETVSTGITLLLAFAVFGHIGACVIFVVICFTVKSILFYLHERIWHQISYGKRYDETITKSETKG